MLATPVMVLVFMEPLLIAARFPSLHMGKTMPTKYARPLDFFYFGFGGDIKSSNFVWAG